MRNLVGLLLGLAAVVASAAEQYGAPLTLKTPVTLEAAVQSLALAVRPTCSSNRRSRRCASSAAAGSL